MNDPHRANPPVSDRFRRVWLDADRRRPFAIAEQRRAPAGRGGILAWILGR